MEQFLLITTSHIIRKNNLIMMSPHKQERESRKRAREIQLSSGKSQKSDVIDTTKIRNERIELPGQVTFLPLKDDKFPSVPPNQLATHHLSVKKIDKIIRKMNMNDADCPCCHLKKHDKKSKVPCELNELALNRARNTNKSFYQYKKEIWIQMTYERLMRENLHPLPMKENQQEGERQ